MSSQHAFSQRKVVSQFEKWNEQPCVLIMPDLQELHWTNEPKAERIHATRLGYAAQTVYLLGPEPRAALDHATLLYTALGDTVKVVEFIAESITSLSNLVRSIQIRRRILLKKRISEQTPLKALFNKHKSPPFTMDLTTTWTTCGRNGLMFSSVFKCFTQLFPALQSFKYYQIWTLFLMCWHYLFILHRLPPFIKLKVS